MTLAEALGDVLESPAWWDENTAWRGVRGGERFWLGSHAFRKDWGWVYWEPRWRRGRMKQERKFCEVEDCLDPATRGTRCECHAKQLQRNGRVRQKGIGSGARHPTPWARVTEACLALADVDANPAADVDYRRARDRLRRAVRNYAASRGWLLAR